MNIFDVTSYMPHGMCFLWQPNLLLLHVISDALIAIAYFSIPVVLVYVVRRRADLPFLTVFRMFSAFIVSCGLTHVMSIVVIWYPAYWLEGVLKALTAILSVATAVALVPLLPRILSLRSPAQLEKLNLQLSAAVDEAEVARVRLADLATEMQQQSVTDALTELTNRRGFDERLAEATANSRRSGGVASLLMIDIDNFKEFNDTYGHLRGDACLREVAEAIRKAARRPRDVVARFGGEEFAVIMEGTDTAGAHHLAERIRTSVEALQIAQGSGANHPVVTVSVGAATGSRQEDLIPDLLLSRADQALYSAKAAGGNVIVGSDERTTAV